MTIPSMPMAVNGPDVSQLIAGFWRLKHWGWSPQQLFTYIKQNVEQGITTMDHAMVYGSEAPFGQALAIEPSLRAQIQLVTKCGIRPMGFGELGAEAVNHYDSSHTAIIQSVESSLRNFQTDYIDILLIHRPDYLMQIEEVAEAFRLLRQQGKVRYFGVSNFSVQQFECLQHAWPELVTNQIEFSPYHMDVLDSGILEQCVANGVRPMLWSCLAGGKLLSPSDEKGERIVQALSQVAEELGGVPLDAVVYAWLLAHPSEPLPILGTSNIERVKSAAMGVGLMLNREQWYRIWEASNGASVP